MPCCDHQPDQVLCHWQFVRSSRVGSESSRAQHDHRYNSIGQLGQVRWRRHCHRPFCGSYDYRKHCICNVAPEGGGGICKAGGNLSIVDSTITANSSNYGGESGASKRSGRHLYH